MSVSVGSSYTKGICAKNHEIRGENAYEIKGRNPICRKCHLVRQRRYDQKTADKLGERGQ